VHKVIDPKQQMRPDGRGGFPVLILHGLFQSSGSFVTSEDRSLAFWLARHGGYQVYLGNTRGIFDMGHRNYSRNDPRFWGMSVGLVKIRAHCQTGLYESSRCTTSPPWWSTFAKRPGTTRWVRMLPKTPS